MDMATDQTRSVSVRRHDGPPSVRLHSTFGLDVHLHVDAVHWTGRRSALEADEVFDPVDVVQSADGGPRP